MECEATPMTASRLVVGDWCGCYAECSRMNIPTYQPPITPSLGDWGLSLRKTRLEGHNKYYSIYIMHVRLVQCECTTSTYWHSHDQIGRLHHRSYRDKYLPLILQKILEKVEYLKGVIPRFYKKYFPDNVSPEGDPYCL
jgi:hypothetical protein